ncbi:MAG TPA: HAD-IA family hydrolase, partial [Chloroflexi bacterium]|nr:HAD-IA family hydrolase [Chloroflexota bacterium]
AELGLQPGALERAVFGSRVWDLASTGRCGADEAWAAIAADLGVAPEGIDAFVERFFAGDRVDATLVALIRRLREARVRVGLLSNAPPSRTTGTSTAARWGMEGLFDVQVFSYAVGALKPDPRTYRAALRALQAAPKETLFIDDAPANVVAAQALGIDAVLFRGVPALLDAMRKRGLPVGRR